MRVSEATFTWFLFQEVFWAGIPKLFEMCTFGAFPDRLGLARLSNVQPGVVRLRFAIGPHALQNNHRSQTVLVSFHKTTNCYGTTNLFTWLFLGSF